MENATQAPSQDLTRALSPRSVAVIGASRTAGSVGEAIFKNILRSNYKGIVYPVNPKADSIGGVKTYSTIAQISDPLDLAIVIVPSVIVPNVLRECAAAKIPGAVVISAGFKEGGGKGVQLEEEVKVIAEQNGIALLGPNCLGFINTDPTVQINASFSATMPKAGNIAFVSQSGALCTSVLDYAKGKDVGFSKFISMGNKAVTNEIDFLRMLRDDPLTDVILMYVEDITDGREFIRVARQVTAEIARPKPIIAIKSGRTQKGAKAASSHTGSLAGADEVYDAVFMQSGVMRVETVEELFDYARAFSQQPLPKGNRVAIVTNAGGPGIMATDACVRHGLDLAVLEEETKKKLKQDLPATANLNNPVDVIGDARHDRYEKALRAIGQDPNVDGIIVILTPQAMTDIKEIGAVVASVHETMKVSPWMAKPLLASFMGVVDVSEGVKILERSGVPHYVFPESAARSLAQMYQYRKKWLSGPLTGVKLYPAQKDLVKKIFARVRSERRNYLPEKESLEVLSAYGIPGLDTRLATSEEEAIKFASDMGPPVALKISSPKIVHKIDAGGVALNLKNATEVSRAYRKVVDTARALVGEENILGVEIQKMAGRGLELFMGSKKDPVFGPVVVFGLGGTFVEVFRDVTFRLAPITERSTRLMIEGSKAHQLLKGYRGEPYDIDRVKECLGRLSQLVFDFQEIEELDINPLIVYPRGNGARAVDGRILLSS